MSTYNSHRALELLRIGCGNPEATFRDGQEKAIQHIVNGHGRLLVVQRTGWGKSFVYFIATKLLREQGCGPALLVSPLLSLMRNQLEAARLMGVRAATINSSNHEQWAEVETSLSNDTVDILLISPERLANDYFSTNVLASIAARISLLVVDEAHCISDWGHDFRPHYRLLERTVRSLPPNVQLLATTATANNRVMEDLQTVLGPGLSVSRGNLARPSLSLQTIRMDGRAERLAWLAEQVPRLQGNGIIYTLTARDANQVAQWLQKEGLNVKAYTGKIETGREELEQALLDNKVKALVATLALGMGFDKPDLAFVIHYQTPGSVVAYYQQVGRAGRGLSAAYGILLNGREDKDIIRFFIKSAFPTKEEVKSILAALEGSPSGLSVPELLGQLNLSKGRITKTLALLSLESPAPLAKQGSKWQLTAAKLTENFWSRAERLTSLRQAEQRQMQDYARLSQGHMAFLLAALDGNLEQIPPPSLPPLPSEVTPATITRASEFLRRTSLPILPRKMWPAGGLPKYDLKGKIPPNARAQEGRALCLWGDGGWGELVNQGKYSDKRFCDELVAACVQVVHNWAPTPAPQWVTNVPSRRRPMLVKNFARRLATALGLPFHSALEKIDDRPEQKTMENSTQQAKNVDGSLDLLKQPLPSGPVLLVDDMVDSRWTITVSAYLLAESGGRIVWPFVLAQTGRF